MPATIAAGWPEHSISASTSPGSSSPAFSTRVAPVRSATSSRWSLTSEIATSVAPNALATCMASSPIGPAPVTSTRSPAEMPALRHAQMPTDTGSISAPTSSDMSSGSAKAKSSWITTRSVNAPSIGGVPKKETSAQRLYRPARHSRQRPHGTPGSRQTRSPTACLVTSEPTAATRPADSWPRISGSFATRSPIRPCSYQCTSEPQTPTDVTSTSTSRGAGSGTGRSSIAISRGRMRTAARFVMVRRYPVRFPPRAPGSRTVAPGR